MVSLIKKLLRKDPHKDDPYWDYFLNRPMADPKNLVMDVITRSPGGGLFGQKLDVHDPKAMAGHCVQLIKFFGADLAGVIATDPNLVQIVVPDGISETELLAPGEQLLDRYPYTIVSMAHWAFDAKDHPGMAGQLGRQKVAAANFHLRSYIREIGYQAIFATPVSNQLAVKAGIATLDGQGRITTSEFGRDVVWETVILTNLPMIPTSGHSERSEESRSSRHSEHSEESRRGEG